MIATPTKRLSNQQRGSFPYAAMCGGTAEGIGEVSQDRLTARSRSRLSDEAKPPFGREMISLSLTLLREQSWTYDSNLMDIVGIDVIGMSSKSQLES